MSGEYSLLENTLDNDDDDDDEENSVRASAAEDHRIAKSAMTESYSEILNNPLFDNVDVPDQQIDIQKRRPTTLSRKQSSQGMVCISIFATSFSVKILGPKRKRCIIFHLITQQHSHMDPFESMKAI